MINIMQSGKNFYQILIFLMFLCGPRNVFAISSTQQIRDPNLINVLRENKASSKVPSTATMEFLDRISISASASFPFRHSIDYNKYDGNNYPKLYNSEFNTGLRYSYHGYFAAVSFNNFRKRQPWQNDFSYSLGYQKWAPYTISLQYVDDSANRVKGQNLKEILRPDENTVTIDYKFTYPYFFKPPATVKNDSRFSGSVGISLLPTYSDENGKSKHWKNKLFWSTSYKITDSLSGSITLYHYLDHKSQQPWDADFAYSLFYYKPIVKGVLIIQYSNYNYTRFPFRSKNRGFLALRDSTISIGWSCSLADFITKTDLGKSFGRK